MTTKRKYEVKTSLKGTLVFPHFNIPDSKFTKPGNRPDYRGKLRVDKTVFATSGWQKYLDDLAEAALDNATDQQGQPLSPVNKAKAKAKGLVKPYSQAYDKDGNELPYFDVSFKVSDGGIDTKTGEEYSNKPKQFDTSSPPKTVDLTLRSGTEAKVSYTVFPWATAALGYGITLRPKAIQIFKLATSGTADAAFFGFEGDEDGYHADETGAEAFGNQDAGGYQSGSQSSGAGIDDMEDIPF